MLSTTLPTEGRSKCDKPKKKEKAERQKENKRMEIEG